MTNICISLFLSDIKQYKNNLSTKKISRGILIAFLLGTLIPRDVGSFIRLLSNSAQTLFVSTPSESLIAILVFNVILFFSYLMQNKVLPIAYNTNYIPSIFEGRSFAISRSIFFVFSNWFVLAWVLTGLQLSSVDINLITSLKIIFVMLNIPVTLSLLHEKRYLALPILFVQTIIFAYLSHMVLMSMLNVLLLMILNYKIYDNHAGFKHVNFCNRSKKYFLQNIYRNFIHGPQSLRVGIMLRSNLLSSISIVLTLIFLYMLFYNSMHSSEENRIRITYMFTLFVLYLLSFVYAKLKLERSKYKCFIGTISAPSTELIHDFIFVLILVGLTLVISIYNFPVKFEWLELVNLTFFSVSVLAAFCYLSTLNSRYRKVYLFMTFCLIMWLIVWNF
jgi:hypothetical protein